MHNVNVDALNQTIVNAEQDPSALTQHVSFNGEWQSTDGAPVQHIDWYLEVDADAPQKQLDELKRIADERCPGVYCLRNPIELATHLVT